MFYNSLALCPMVFQVGAACAGGQRHRRPWGAGRGASDAPAEAAAGGRGRGAWWVKPSGKPGEHGEKWWFNREKRWFYGN